MKIQEFNALFEKGDNTFLQTKKGRNAATPCIQINILSDNDGDCTTVGRGWRHSQAVSHLVLSDQIKILKAMMAFRGKSEIPSFIRDVRFMKKNNFLIFSRITKGPLRCWQKMPNKKTSWKNHSKNTFFSIMPSHPQFEKLVIALTKEHVQKFTNRNTTLWFV